LQRREVGDRVAQGPGPEQQQQRDVAAPQTSSPASAGGVSSSAGTVLHVQRVAGNRAASAFVQARLVVGHATDPSEFEADAIADAVVRGLRDASSGDEEGGDAGAGVVRRRSGGNDPLGGLPVDTDTTRDIESARSGGRSLPAGVRRSMEDGFGSDFASVRIHDDRGADSLNRRLQAKAFTTGADIFFRAGEFEPQTDQGQHLLAHELAHVVQQSAAPAAVSRVVQREEEDEKRDRLEQEITKKEKKRDRTDTAAIKKERQLAQKYGKRIGPADSEVDMGELDKTTGKTEGKGKAKVNPHFSMKMLNKIEQMLDLLPEAHVKGNASLLGLLNDEATMDGPASTYSFESEYIGLHKPVAMMPEWLYLALSPKYAVLRKQMDQMTIERYHPGGDYKGKEEGVGKYRKERDKRLGVDTKDRHIFGGVSNALCGSSLVEYTIVHEIGHSVDKQIGWEKHLSQEPMFGGWKTFKERGPILSVFIEAEDLKKDDLNRPRQFRNKRSLGAYLDYHWASEDLKELQAGTEELAATGDALAEKLANVVSRLQFAQAQPWTFDDGGGDKVDVDGRMYGLDYHGTWQSYLRKERDYAVSNYQFSEPGEWFGEAYAAFYGESEAARHRLSKAVQVWFDKTLGPPPSMKQDDDAPASLVDTEGGGAKLGTFDAESALASVKAVLAELADEFDATYL